MSWDVFKREDISLYHAHLLRVLDIVMVGRRCCVFEILIQALRQLGLELLHCDIVPVLLQDVPLTSREVPVVQQRGPVLLANTAYDPRLEHDGVRYPEAKRSRPAP